MATSQKFHSRVKPAGKTGRRGYAGQSINTSAKRGGGGTFNWGNAMDAAEYEDYDYEEEEEEEVLEEPSMLAKMHAASIVQQKALAAKNRREGTPSEAASEPKTAWGQTNRLTAMKERLLALEREKIAQMAPDRLELMNLLADHGYTLDENTISAICAWKRA